MAGFQHKKKKKKKKNPKDKKKGSTLAEIGLADDLQLFFRVWKWDFWTPRKKRQEQ